MYLKSLELHGFKSFPNRTVLTFERGATVIVGPNGSGKSNISDAMRWVLGELSSRNLRGTKMEDVIFGGADTRRPMGFAEVSVTFDNSDPQNRLDSEYDEVTVTRRYYRTGESEYLINKQPKRLRDIYELFMNTGVGREGYSIIGQGKIAEIISKKSDERRNIFEEAAGISKYRHRKEEAERKLKATQDNIDRHKDILSVLEAQVGPLEKDAEKARKGLAIYEEKKRADVSLWLYDTEKIKGDIDTADNAHKLSLHELEIIDQAIADLDMQNEALYNKAQANRLLSEELLGKIRLTESKINKLITDINLANSDFRHSADFIEQYRARIKEIEASMASLLETRLGYEEKKAESDKRVEELMDERLDFLAKHQEIQNEVEKLRSELNEALDELTVEENSANDYKVRINVLTNSRVQDGTKSQDIEREIEKYEKEGIALKAEADKCERNASGFKTKIAAKDEIIEDRSTIIDELSLKRDEETKELNSIKLEQDQLIQRADVLQRMNDHFEGYFDSVKFVMREFKAGNINGTVYGPLSSLINVDKQYITAIETSLGASLQNIVVEDEDTAKASILALKRANAGRATFYPITAIKPATETEEIRLAKSINGYVGRADTLVKSENKYRSIIEMLLLRTVVFDNIDNASAAAKRLNYKVKIVTLDGQIINAGGAFTGGSTKRDSGILSRLTEIEGLKEKSKRLNKRINELNSNIIDYEKKIKEAREELKDAEQDKELLLTLSRGQFSALDTANANLKANQNLLEKFRYDYNNLIGQQSLAEEEIVRLNAEYNANLERIEALKDIRAKKSERMGVLDENADEMQDKANALSIKIAEAEKDSGTMASFIDDINNRIE
ncbi:MAG: chromosome segregation protein SMC, partial [Clostridia bacterium]|nr:chromosome segregation protein SMC [Clostridia bacterium]